MHSERSTISTVFSHGQTSLHDEEITEEIIRLMPDEERYPRPTAEAVRSFLMLRLGLHLGLRQKNLRQLMLNPKGSMPRSERALEKMKRGEIRWSEREGGWEVFIPAIAFKNAHSSFFGDKPFRLVFPDLLDLYKYIDAYFDYHRSVLLKSAADPGTVLGIRSPMMPERYPTRLENQRITGS
jgi:hypothetical protein